MESCSGIRFCNDVLALERGQEIDPQSVPPIIVSFCLITRQVESRDKEAI